MASSTRLSVFTHGVVTLDGSVRRRASTRKLGHVKAIAE
jgi:hypothetical protein